METEPMTREIAVDRPTVLLNEFSCSCIIA